MNVFGNVLSYILMNVPDSETRLICLQHLWHLAFKEDRWAVQDLVKKVFNKEYIPKSIETQLSEYIIRSETEVEERILSSLALPSIVKAAIIKSNEIFNEKQAERLKHDNEDSEDLPW